MDESNTADSGMKYISPLQAIRKHCIECSGDNINEVKACPCTDCPLYIFRMGKNPFRKPKTEEQREAARQQMLNRLAERQTSPFTPGATP